MHLCLRGPQCFDKPWNCTLEQHGCSPTLLNVLLTSEDLLTPLRVFRSQQNPCPPWSAYIVQSKLLPSTYCLSSPRPLSHPGPVPSLVTSPNSCALVWQSCRLLIGQRKLRRCAASQLADLMTTVPGTCLPPCLTQIFPHTAQTTLKLRS